MGHRHRALPIDQWATVATVLYRPTHGVVVPTHGVVRIQLRTKLKFNSQPHDMAQENNDADTAPVPATETSLLQAALVSGSQEGQCGLPSVPPVPLVSKPKLVSQSQEGPSEASIATLTPHSNEDGDDTGQQISLDAETTIAEAAKPKKGRGRPPKNADKKGTRGRPRKHVAQGPPSSSTAGQSSQPGLRKRGRPRKGIEPEKLLRTSQSAVHGLIEARKLPIIEEVSTMVRVILVHQRANGRQMYSMKAQSIMLVTRLLVMQDGHHWR